MDFTREPIIETVITPREGYRLVVRSSKGAGSEEHFVDALEVVSFGSGVFFRSMERPKPFIVPVADYEVLEVREPRMVLKTPSEGQAKAPVQRLRAQEPKADRDQSKAESRSESRAESRSESKTDEASQAASQEPKAERNGRRDRRQRFRRRRGGRDDAQATGSEEQPAGEQPAQMASEELSSTPMLSSILPPPTKLIRDDLKRLREDYKGAFYINEDKDTTSDDDDASLATLGTTSEDEMSFREEPYSISDEDIRMTEGEVPSEGSFRKEEANSSSSQDLP